MDKHTQRKLEVISFMNKNQRRKKIMKMKEEKKKHN